jgi:tRNA (guanine37-N1)-methyltransferase
MLRCEIITLFPDMVRPVLEQSMLKRAQDKGLVTVQVRNLRDFTLDRHHVADDAPYGGGAGMVIKADPVFRAVERLRAEHAALRLILPSPQGRPFTQALARELAEESRALVFLCGHYEGLDERVRLRLAPEEISIGDYVLTGGELPALVMIDAAVRLVPGVVGDPDSVRQDSFMDSLLDFPHYTRPAEVAGLNVPEVLLSGNHEAIRRWRRRQALRNTYLKRPDLLRDRALTEEDKELLSEISASEPHESRRSGEEG